MKIYLTKGTALPEGAKETERAIEILALKWERSLEKSEVKQTLAAKVVRTNAKAGAFEGAFVLWTEEEAERKILFRGRLLMAQRTDTESVWLLRFAEDLEGTSPSESPLTNPDEPARDLTPFVFEGTVKIQEASAPRCLRLTLQAEWLQKLGGVLDLGSRVAALFPKGHASSLNRAFGSAQFDGAKSGYTILEASFTPEMPPETGILDLYPLTTPPMVLAAREGKKSSEMVLPRYWFQTTWRVAWLYEQKRIETLSTEIPLNEAGEGALELRFKVPNVEALDGFDEGKATLEPLWPTLLKEVETQLKTELFERFQETITVSVPFEVGSDMALGQTVRVRLADEVLCGEVRAVMVEAEGVQREARVTMACAARWLKLWRDQAWKLGALQEREPLQGLTASLTADDAILDGTVENDAEAQFALLAGRTWTSPQEIAAFLKSHATRIDLRLRDLRTRKHLEHALMAEVDVGTENGHSH